MRAVPDDLRRAVVLVNKLYFYLSRKLLGLSLLCLSMCAVLHGVVWLCMKCIILRELLNSLISIAPCPSDLVTEKYKTG